MRNEFATPPSLGAPPSGGPVTRALCIALIGVTLLSFLAQRAIGFGPRELIFDREAILAGEVWRLVTYIFIEMGSPIALLFGALMLWLLGGAYEQRWGSRVYLRFFLLASVGGALWGLPLGSLLDRILPFRDIGLAQGPTAAIDALIVATALTAPDGQVMFGFLMPIRARHLVWAALALQLIGGIMTGAASPGITLGGMLMGYVLVTGLWHPMRLLTHVRTHYWVRRRTRGLYVVPPRNKRDLH